MAAQQYKKLDDLYPVKTRVLLDFSQKIFDDFGDICVPTKVSG